MTDSKTAWLLLLAALLLFTTLFATGGTGKLDFWAWMTLNAVALVGACLVVDKSYSKIIVSDLRIDPAPKILIGLLSAVLLYIVFALGNYFSQMMPFAKNSIASVYELKHGASGIRIALLLLLIIGPGEELLWRGYFQRVFWNSYGTIAGFAISTLFYFAMHLPSMNIMLLVAAGVCGVFWGYLYIRYRSILINVISHTAWDLAVFLLFPFR